MQLELHIKNEGTPNTIDDCAVARAFRAAGVDDPRVLGGEATFELNGEAMHCRKLPSAVLVAIEAFDRGISFDPFKAVVEAEPWTGWARPEQT